MLEDVPPDTDRAEVVAELFPELESFFAPKQAPFAVPKALALLDTLRITGGVGTASVWAHVRLLQASRRLHVKVNRGVQLGHRVASRYQYGSPRAGGTRTSVTYKLDVAPSASWSCIAPDLPRVPWSAAGVSK